MAQAAQSEDEWVRTRTSLYAPPPGYVSTEPRTGAGRRPGGMSRSQVNSLMAHLAEDERLTKKR